MQAIVCVSENWGIGVDGDLLFRISADMKRFKELTVGKTVIYGKRTLKTFPGGKPLPDRRNIVLTHSEEPIEGAELAHTPEEAVALAGDDAIVIGGASVYTQMRPYFDRVRATKVFAAPKADSFFPNLDKHADWRIESEGEILEENGLKFQYIDYVKKQAHA